MKKINRFLVVFGLAAFLLLSTVSIVSAAEAGPFYVGVFGGYVIPEDLEINDDDDWYDDDDEGFDVDLDESWAIGVKFGYIIPPVKWLAAELEYTYLADQDLDESWTGNGWSEQLSGNFSAHNLMANLLFRYPEGKIHPYVGFGFGLSMATFEADYTFENKGVYSESIDEDDTAAAGQFIAGVNFEIMPNVSADLAYKYFYCEYEIDDDDFEVKNHMITLGVNYHF